MFAPADARPDVPNLITDVPRLNHREGEPSRLQLPSHDLATPAVGVFDPTRGAGLWVLTQQRTRLGPYGFHIDESPDRSSARITISSPCVRQGRRGWATWLDAVPDWAAGTAADQLSFTVRLHRFACADVPALFRRFADVRRSVAPPRPQTSFACAPFAACYAEIERLYQTMNWREEPGFYGDATPQHVVHWQLGWVGNAVASAALVASDDSQSRRRALRTLDWMAASQAPSGLLRAFYKDGEWVGDGFGRPGTQRYAMVRKEGDALYFGLKHLAWLTATDHGDAIQPAWRAMFEKLADALARVWRRHGQFGQFLDDESGDLVVGNSTAGAVAIAGLALAGQYFHRPDLLDAAAAAGAAYHDRWTLRGVTTGGPGEILACPDSESAMGMVEALVVLYEVTGDRAWLPRAAAAADQLASWVVSYPFQFPPESDLGRLGVDATGTVIANSQNKHSAPGLCTFSGDALLKLARATGERRFAELLSDVAGTLPQFMSRADRVVGTSAPGVMCERVNLSDWEGDHKVGHVPPWPCWCEASLLLTAVEVPGVYVQPDAGWAIAFDNVEAAIVGHDAAAGSVVVDVRNRTPLDAAYVNVMCEPAAAARDEPLGQGWQARRFTRVPVPAGQAVRLACDATGVRRVGGG